MLTTPCSAVKVLTWTQDWEHGYSLFHYNYFDTSWRWSSRPFDTPFIQVMSICTLHLASKYHSQFCHLFYPEFQNKLDIDCNRSMALKMHTTQEFWLDALGEPWCKVCFLCWHVTDGTIPNTDLHNQLGPPTKSPCILPHQKPVSFATAAH